MFGGIEKEYDGTERITLLNREITDPEFGNQQEDLRLKIGMDDRSVFHLECESTAGDARVMLRYDKLETVVITMNADGIKSESELIRYLSLLLNREMPQEERVEALKNEYHIQVDDALREDVSKMCNYSDAILRMGENKGLEQGRIMEAVSIYRDEMEMDDNSIIKKIMKRFTLQEQDARKYVIPQSNAKN